MPWIPRPPEDLQRRENSRATMGRHSRRACKERHARRDSSSPAALCRGEGEGGSVGRISDTASPPYVPSLRPGLHTDDQPPLLCAAASAALHSFEPISTYSTPARTRRGVAPAPHAPQTRQRAPLLHHYHHQTRSTHIARIGDCSSRDQPCVGNPEPALGAECVPTCRQGSAEGGIGVLRVVRGVLSSCQLQ